MIDQFESKTVKYRQLTFVATFLFLTTIYFLLKDSGWHGNKQLHTIMEIVATLLALGAGFLALVRFYTQKDNTFLFIGAAFIGVAFLDGYHALATSDFFDQIFPSPAENLIPWSWNASRTFLSVAMYASYLVWKTENQRDKPLIIREQYVYLVIGIFTFLSFLFFAFIPLPRAYYPEFFFGRPEEFIAALFFLMAIIGYYRKGWWKNSAFEYWMVISLIVGFLSQALFMAFSSQLFDMQFGIAHLLKKVSYLCIHAGLLTSFFYLFRDSEKQKIQILAEIKERELAEKNMAKYRKHNELILESASEGIIGLDKKGVHTFVNPAALEILGFTQDELLHNESHSLWHHSTEPGQENLSHDCPILNAMRNEVSFSSEKDVFWHKNGTAVHVQYSVSLLKQDQKVIGSMIVFQDLSKIHHSEAELHKLSNIIEQSPTTIVITDLNGNIEYVNPAFSERTGYMAKEALGKNPRILSSGKNQPDFKNLWDKLVNGKTWRGEFHNKKKNGELYWESAIISPLKDKAGNPTHYVAIKTDITQQKEQEEKLKKSQNLINLFLSNSSAVIYIKEADGKYLLVNKIFERLFNIIQEEIVGKSDHDIFPKEMANEFRNHDLKVIAAKKQIKIEEEAPHSDGTHTYLSVKFPLVDEQGEVYAVGGISTDITDEKALQARLWHSENLVRMILDQIPQRIFWKDKEYKYLGANKLFASDAGFSNGGELIGRDDMEMPWKDIAHLYREDDRTIIEDGKIKINFEEPFIDGDGNEHWVRTSKQPLVDQDGNIFGILGNFEDITKRKTSERQLQEYATALEKSNKELEDFANIASHDLQEPLRKVITFGNRLKEKHLEALPDNAQDYLNRMNNAATRMRILINDLLDFSRVTSRAKGFKEVDLNEVIKDVVHNLEIKIEEENAVLNIDTLPSIEADTSQIYRLFQNIIGNSLKYRKNDQNPEIKIYSKIANRDGLDIAGNSFHSYCYIYFEDNGIGFDEKYLDRIFAPFQRLHGKKEYEGTGMGLAICSKIVTRHNGLLSAKSIPGKGSVFIVNLPFKQCKKENRL